jgi:NAD(P)H-dependent flavin oxidoreductase YrpB (nitropropane dioxygenase family)
VDPHREHVVDRGERTWTNVKTDLCRQLGIEHPIICAPMGPDMTGPEIVAAVCNAGGLGILQAQLCAPPQFRDATGASPCGDTPAPHAAGTRASPKFPLVDGG